MNIQAYLKEIIKEMRLTTFPTQNIVVNFTLFVIIFTAAMAVFLGALDLLFGDAILKGISTLKESAFVTNLHSQNLIESATTTLIK